MGSPQCDYGRGLYNEEELQVTLTRAFEIQQTEVTRAQWSAAGFAPVTSGPPLTSDCLQPDCPMGASWEDAAAFANRLSELHQPALPACYRLIDCTGTVGVDMSCQKVEQAHASVYECPGYRLPTEAEWEYAARAGTRTSFYLGPFVRNKRACIEEPFLAPAAWYCFNAEIPHAAKQRVPNAWGLFDMLGNVHEWTSDPYANRRSYDGVRTTIDPGDRLPPAPAYVTTRGGSTAGTPTTSTITKRLTTSVKTRGFTYGFRLVRTLTAGDGGG
jgi:formylglycine-generating enzyme